LPDRKRRGKLLEKGVRIPGTGVLFNTHIAEPPGSEMSVAQCVKKYGL